MNRNEACSPSPGPSFFPMKPRQAPSQATGGCLTIANSQAKGPGSRTKGQHRALFHTEYFVSKTAKQGQLHATTAHRSRCCHWLRIETGERPAF